jgi:hypothetical protein
VKAVQLLKPKKYVLVEMRQIGRLAFPSNNTLLQTDDHSICLQASQRPRQHMARAPYKRESIDNPLLFHRCRAKSKVSDAQLKPIRGSSGCHTRLPQ